jgi:hypothetical protein
MMQSAMSQSKQIKPPPSFSKISYQPKYKEFIQTNDINRNEVIDVDDMKNNKNSIDDSKMAIDESKMSFKDILERYFLIFVNFTFVVVVVVVVVVVLYISFIAKYCK